MEREKKDVILRVSGLKTRFRVDKKIVNAVNGVDFELRRGKTLCVVGESGCGKSVTAHTIMQLLPKTGYVEEGTVDYFSDREQGIRLTDYGRNSRQIRQIRGRDIAMIFQDPMTSLDPVNTVGSQIEEMIRLHSELTRKEIRQAAEQMLETVGIKKERFDDYPHQFSGGMKQRVVIAMALSCNPRLLIADEPTTALDVTIQAQILELMRGLKSKYDTAMILITHDLGVVADICDTVAIMYAGQIVEYGTVEEIYKDHRHPYTEGLFHSIPDIDTEQKKLKVIRGMTPDPTNIPSGCAFHPRCQYAMEICSQKCPEDSLVRENHFVKCFLNSEEGIN